MPTSKKTKPPKVRRSDRAGHLDSRYAADLLALAKREKDDPPSLMRSDDSLAEQLGEAAVRAMTSGEDDGPNTFSAVVAEEQGGPFIITRARRELAKGTDGSNPAEATREPFPKT